MSFEFRQHAKPHPWEPRRYQPIIVKESAYAVLLDGREWRIASRYYDTGGYENTAWFRRAVPREVTRSHDQLVAAINDVKVAFSSEHRRGGKFRINEYGQVLVPTEAGGRASAWCVGEVDGYLEFLAPTGRVFDFRSVGLAPGTRWSQPLMAMHYTVRGDGTITFDSHTASDTVEVMSCPGGQPQLVAEARRLRGGGLALFVNDQAAAVVKDDVGSEFYVGDVQIDDWFEKEPCT